MLIRSVSYITFVLVFGRALSDEHHPDGLYGSPMKVNGKVEDPSYWSASAQKDLANKLTEQLQLKKAKNIIFYLGDGWGISTIVAARILKGKERDNVTFGEEGELHTDTFPYSGVSKTYCTDAQTADSACSATAYLGGVKANYGTIGVTSDVSRRNCTAGLDTNNHVSSILEWAQKAGKSTGIISTVEVTNASPAGTYSHTSNRDWECDANIGENSLDPPECNSDNTDDIAEQLILREPGQNINVILGGGRRKFLPIEETDEESLPGLRKDKQNLIKMWRDTKASNTSINATYVVSKDELLRVDASRTDYLLGLFSNSHVAYYHEQDASNDPSLAEMTQKAIEILRKNPEGFFLFVEGGRIDHGHHDNEALRAIWEAVEFDRAIKTGDDMTDDDETLIVITADHSHSFIFNGYGSRGSKISGFGGVGLDNLPFSTMSYANGPGFKNFTNNRRHNISEDDVDDVKNRIVPLVHVGSESHGGEDVMIFAKGPFAHLFSGIHQQSYIPHAMAYAACIGSGLTFCET